ncbi:MAG: TIGR04255 family protein [Pseudomonadota bacterium]
MTRPENLPDFGEPPLAEVVLGVQFSPCPGFTSVDTRKVYELFESDYPVIQEHPRLEPHYETFGGVKAQPGLQFHVGAPQTGSRLWFISRDGGRILQFQLDRFFSNWRKTSAEEEYPRFEGIAQTFKSHLTDLENHFSSGFSYQLDINQVEITYVNLISIDSFSEVSDFFSIAENLHVDFEGLNMSFSEEIRDSSDSARARMSHSIQSLFTHNGQKRAFNLTLTVKGRPSGSDIDSAIDFITKGRTAIVQRFAEITSASAHRKWKREQ